MPGPANPGPAPRPEVDPPAQDASAERRGGQEEEERCPVLDGHPGRDIAGLQQTEQHGAGDQHEGDRQHQQDELGAVDDARNQRRRAGMLGLFVGATSPVSPPLEPGPQLREPLAIVTSELWS